MLKVKVIKPFYYAEGKELYVDENRYQELKDKGLVEEVKEIKQTVVKNSKIEKAILNDEGRVLSN